MKDSIAEAMAVSKSYTEARLKAKAAEDALHSFKEFYMMNFVTRDDAEKLNAAIATLSQIQTSASPYEAQKWAESNIKL